MEGRLCAYLIMLLMVVGPLTGPMPFPEGADGTHTITGEAPVMIEGSETGDLPVRTSLSPAPRIEELEYAAIGPSVFEVELKPLIEWKTQKGVKAVFFSLEDINSSYGAPEKDRAETIRDFLVALKGRNQGLEWVLLAGDGEIIPPRYVFVNGSAEDGRDDPDNFVATDYYYAGLDRERGGDWDINQNGIYGEDYLEDDKKFEEKDFTADVYVGRFPASTRDEVRMMVSKQISYEMDPPPGSWASSMLLSGSLMDVPNDPVQYDAYKDNAYELVLKVKEDLPSTVTPFQLVDYPQIEYGGYNVMFDSLNRSSFGSYYEAGFSTVLIACHGDPFNGNCTNYKGEGGGRWSYDRDYDEHFTYGMAETIRNGERLPLVYISSCASTDFDEIDDTNMERLLLNEDGGAICLIGATVETYRGEFRPDPGDQNSTYSFGNWWLAQEYFKLLYHGVPRPGEALYKQKWNYQLHLEYDLGRTIDIDQFSKIFNIDSLAYNLLGDPEGPIWLNEPSDMIVQVSDTFDHEKGFDVTVVDSLSGKPLPGTEITVTDPLDPEVYLSVRIGSNGTIHLLPDITKLGTLRVVATKEGYLPYIGSIEATSGWDLQIDNEIVLVPDPPVYGEPFKAVFTIRNNGDTTIEHIFLYWTWYATSGKSPMNANFEDLSPGDLTFRTNITWGNNDDPVLTAWVEIFPQRLESNSLNNMASRDLKVNHPLEMDLMDRITLEEDETFTERYKGERLDLISMKRIVDTDGPSPLEVWGEVEYGNITLEQDPEDRSFEIVPEIDWSGGAAIRFYATDGSVTRNDLVLVEVLEVPDPPRFPQISKIKEVREDEPTNFTMTLFDVDSEEIALNTSTSWVYVEKVSGGHNSIFNITVLPTDRYLGANLVTFTATDGDTPEVELIMTINVTQTNDPPKVLSPARINATRGRDLDINLQIEDPDGDLHFSFIVEWTYGRYEFGFSNFTLKIPEDASKGEHIVIITVDDGNSENGVTEYQLVVDIRDRPTEDFSLIFIIMIVLIFSFLIIYGVFLRVQERRQKRILDSVGTNAPREARALSEKDFKNRPGRRVRTDESIPVPPAPIDVEGALIREGDHPVMEGETRENDPDMEMDLDEILSEMFPDNRG
ncbi:MAG: hypothetical protein JXA22_08635 [Candidatus Thermoplasmatota archaeon]|nr:hypothetical protein [Candidatus Thermoplasmatota archaeon]